MRFICRLCKAAVMCEKYIISITMYIHCSIVQIVQICPLNVFVISRLDTLYVTLEIASQ